MFTTNSKFLETATNSLSVVLVKFEDYRSEASHKMTQSGKHWVYFDHLEQFGISFKTLEKFRRRFRIFQIVSFFCGVYGKVWPFGTVTVK